MGIKELWNQALTELLEGKENTGGYIYKEHFQCDGNIYRQRDIIFMEITCSFIIT